jgi:trehalose 2-sulfotransferase
LRDEAASRSYVLACTPRVGSHLLADALTSTRMAGCPKEWLPRFAPDAVPLTPRDRLRLVTQPPSQETYDAAIDGAYVKKVLASGTGENGVFGIVIHWFVLQDAVRRLGAFFETSESAPHRVLSSALPNLSYLWLKRRDKIAQAVSWYTAIQTGTYVGRHARTDAHEDERVRFDYAQIRYLLTAITAFENGWGSFFSASGVKPFVINYEDLSADYVAAIRSVLDFLQLDAAGADIALPKREKYADARSREWIERFKLEHNQARPGEAVHEAHRRSGQHAP